VVLNFYYEKLIITNVLYTKDLKFITPNNDTNFTKQAPQYLEKKNMFQFFDYASSLKKSRVIKIVVLREKKLRTNYLRYRI